MEPIGQWRPTDVAVNAMPDAGRAGPEPQRQWQTIALAVVAVVVLATAGVALWATTPQPQLLLGANPTDNAAEDGRQAEASTGPAGDEPTTAQPILVDVQGAVERPGLHQLRAGSRVGDAVAAAGGYSAQIDIPAAAQQLNLAQRLSDGDKVHVPARGDPPEMDPGPATAGTASEAPGSAGVIDINSATEAQLDTLPGIGPVTAGKIIAAREETPFATVDDLLARKVVGPATFDKIRELVTVNP